LQQVRGLLSHLMSAANCLCMASAPLKIENDVLLINAQQIVDTCRMGKGRWSHWCGITRTKFNESQQLGQSSNKNVISITVNLFPPDYA
jgi:hypothetical protein